MPEGSSAEGILVTGFGHGPTGNGDVPYARARRDGTFALRIPAGHNYVLGINDLKWATDPWTGMILVNDAAKPAEIAMNVYPATPVTVRVTRGPAREPVVNAWVNLTSKGKVNWTDKTGLKISGTGAGVRTWLTTDADGVARAGVGKGEHELRLSSGDWNEERTVHVNSEKPVELEFHRAWTGEQRIAGRLVLDKACSASPTLVVSMGVVISSIPTSSIEPVVRANGVFEVVFDAESASVLFVDRDQKRSGFAERVQGAAEINVTMEPTATYSGTLVNDHAQPVPGFTLEMCVKTSEFFRSTIWGQQTDKAGRFRFTGVPSNVALEFRNRQEIGEPTVTSTKAIECSSLEK